MDNSHAHGSHQPATFRSYVTGFVLAVVLTLASFWVVMNPNMSKVDILITIAVLALVQVVVHLYYFLHMSMAPDKKWDTISFAFTAMLLFFVVVGSIWIMANMMATLMPSANIPGLSGGMSGMSHMAPHM